MDLREVGFAMLRGCYDSISGISAILTMKDMTVEKTNHSTPYKSKRSGRVTSDKNNHSHVKNESKTDIRKEIFYCSLLNGGVFLLSILLFNFVILPGIQFVCYLVFPKDSLSEQLTLVWIEPIVSLVFTSIWVAPIFILSKAINSLWFQDIAKWAYIQKKGTPPSCQSGTSWIADTIFSLTVETLFLIQAMLVSYIPIYAFGYIFSLVHMCLLYSLYAFEYKWCHMGWMLHRRLPYVERNWPYFIGFGFPLAIITQMSQSWVVSGCLFSLLFPFFIISSTEANPVVNICVYPLHLFTPAIRISNMIFKKALGGRTGTSRVHNR